MQEEMLKDLKDKKIVILGFAREGKSTYEYLRSNFSEKEIDVIDENIDLSSAENKKYSEDINLNIIKTHEYFDLLKNYDYIFKTPGISFKGKDISKIESKITSELDMFLKYFKNKVTTIGITGTKGKSTTSSMLYKVLQDAKKNVHFLGNIGKPIFSNLENIKENDIVVLEISSHQSQYIKNSPNISVILNVFEEHLDHYNSYDEYINAKINIIKYQKNEDYSIYLNNSEDLDRRLKDIKLYSNISKLDLNSKNEFNYFDFNHERNLLGIHNEYNIMVVLRICEILNIDKEIVCKSIYEFLPLEHRLEKVGTFDEITYYNDSISTIPETAIACVNTLKDIDTLIIGGLDRGIDYSKFEEFLISCNVNNIVCMYSTGKKIYDNIKDLSNKNIIYKENLEEAVKIAKEITAKGKICAMSPAAASYGDFKSFEERGNIFKSLVTNKNN